MSKFIHELGVKAKDKITGFEGIIVARSQHITGCNTYGLRGDLDKDGKVNECEWFDEGLLDVTGKGIEPNDVSSDPPGGPLASNPKI